MHAGMARKPTPVWAVREWYRPWADGQWWPMGRWLMQGWDRQNKKTVYVKKMTVVTPRYPFDPDGSHMLVS